MNELEALTILNNLPLLGSVKIRLLVKHFGSAEAVLAASRGDLIGLPGVGSKIADGIEGWRDNDLWKQDLELVAKYGVTLLPYHHPQYPRRLLDIVDHPVLLYMKGQLLPKDARSIAVVGTRHPTLYGQDIADKMGEALASYGFTVVSGLARGVDAAAHRGALRTGRTVAVIGSGLARLYPEEHEELARVIALKGAVISELPMATPPDRMNFPRRNRIVSGMTLASLLVEAPIRSGAMITMERALEQGRACFAIPGRIDTENFRGNHSLIKAQKAKLVENAADIACNFEDLLSFSGSTQKNREDVPLENEEKRLLDHLPQEELCLDDLLRVTKLPVGKLNVLLMSLVLKRQIKEFPGKVYKKI